MDSLLNEFVIKPERETSETTIVLQQDRFIEIYHEGTEKGCLQQETLPRQGGRRESTRPPHSQWTALLPSLLPESLLNHVTECYELKGSVPCMPN